MNKTLRICSLTSLLFSTLALAEPVRLTDENAYLYYESRADIASPSHKLAEYLSQDYKNARDEFTKHDLLQKIEPVLAKKLIEAKDTKTVLLRVRGKLGDYDFNKKAFPTGFGETTFIPFSNDYAASFVNGNDIQFMEVNMEAARELSDELRKTRTATFDIVGSIVGAGEEAVNSWSSKKMLKVKIEKLSVKHKSGAQVGTKLL